MAETLLISPPAVEPVTLAEAKVGLSIDDNRYDDLLQDLLIGAAREQAESIMNRKIVPQTRRWLIDRFPEPTESLKLHPELFPARSIASIQYLDTGGVQRTLAGSVYALDALNWPGYIQLQAGQSWPTDVADSANAVQLEVVCGAWANGAEVPKKIKHWMITWIGTALRHREQFAAGFSVSEFPGRFVDGMLDEFKIYVA